MTKAIKYKPSGSFNAKLLPNTLLLLFILLPATTFLLALVMVYNPIKVLGFFIAYLVSKYFSKYISKLIVLKPKLQNPKIAIVIHFFTAIAFVYLYWVFWFTISVKNGNIIPEFSSQSSINVFISFLNPTALIEASKQVLVNGSFTFFGYKPIPIVLAGLWLYEIVFILGNFQWNKIYKTNLPFNKLKNEWVLPLRIELKAIDNPKEIIKEIQTKGSFNLEALLDEQELESKEENCGRIYFYPLTDDENYVSILKTKYGKALGEHKAKFFIKNTLVSKEFADKIKSLSISNTEQNVLANTAFMGDIYWCFDEREFEDTELFRMFVIDYNLALENNVKTSLDEIATPHKRISVSYEYVDDEDNEIDKTLELTTGNPKGFSHLELLFVIHHKIRQDLNEQDSIFYEGLHKSDEDDSSFYLILGS